MRGIWLGLKGVRRRACGGAAAARFQTTHAASREHTPFAGALATKEWVRKNFPIGDVKRAAERHTGRSHAERGNEDISGLASNRGVNPGLFLSRSSFQR